MIGVQVALLFQLAVGSPVELLDSAVTDGIRQGIYPGAVLMIGGRDGVWLARGYGRHTWSSKSPAVDPERTLWDLASLTKVVATTTAMMLLVNHGRVDIDASVRTYLPRFIGAGYDAITVRHLLTHTSGLPAWRPYAKMAPTRDSMLTLLYSEPLDRRAGDRMVYSDLNAMLLGELVEAVTGERLDVYVGREVFEPLGMRDTHFNLSGNTRGRAAPTGKWRGTPVRGVVHDQNAARLGGVAGHAGLFSTGADLAMFAQFILGEGVPLVRRPVARMFRARQEGAGNRALGWETVPTPETVSSAGQRLSAGSIGHTGFTGTSMWIDFQRGLFVILLTNREYDPRVRPMFRALKVVRGTVADIAALWVDQRECVGTAVAAVAC